MVTSKVDICNLALDLLGGATVVDIDTPTDATEGLLSRWYDQSREQALREHPWKFATKRAILAASNVDPAFEYSSAFPVPSDFLRLLDVQDADGATLINDYQLENNDGVLSVLSRNSATSLRIRYVYNITDISKFSPDFVMYLAMTLALSLAYKVTQSNTSVKRIQSIRADLGKLSKAVSGQERQPTRRYRSMNTRVRRQGSYKNSHLITFD